MRRQGSAGGALRNPYDGGRAFSFLVHKDRQQEREVIFDDVARKFGYRPDQLRFIEALLFLSMIPLHADSLREQLAFFVNAIRKFNADITIDDRASRFDWSLLTERFL